MTTQPREPVLEARGLVRRYGKIPALDGLNLALAPGGAVALLGANGSGKTTALRCMAGELVPSEGEVRVAGADPHAEPEGEAARRALAFVADTPVFYRELTVGEHVRLVAAAFDDSEGVDRAETLLAELGLASRLNARPHELSSGQRQKVMLACVHARRFQVLMLDEPVLRLDPGSQGWLRERLSAHARSGVAIVLATHQPRFAKGLADRVVCLDEGRVVADEPLATFLARGADHEIGRPGTASPAAWFDASVDEPE